MRRKTLAEPRYYQPDGTPYRGHNPKEQWERDFESVQNRVVAKHQLANGNIVHTIWLGEVNQLLRDQPLLYETVAFAPEATSILAAKQTTTLAEAKRMHARFVRKWSRPRKGPGRHADTPL